MIQQFPLQLYIHVLCCVLPGDDLYLSLLHTRSSAGNHESVTMNQMYGFEGEVKQKYPLYLQQTCVLLQSFLPPLTSPLLFFSSPSPLLSLRQIYCSSVCFPELTNQILLPNVGTLYRGVQLATTGTLHWGKNPGGCGGSGRGWMVRDGWVGGFGVCRVGCVFALFLGPTHLLCGCTSIWMMFSKGSTSLKPSWIRDSCEPHPSPWSPRWCMADSSAQMMSLWTISGSWTETDNHLKRVGGYEYH